jgi:uncharacterized protein (DUF486 family)
LQTVALLTISNIFMTIAWYEHLKRKDSPLCVVGLYDVGEAGYGRLSAPGVGGTACREQYSMMAHV